MEVNACKDQVEGYSVLSWDLHELNGSSVEYDRCAVYDWFVDMDDMSMWTMSVAQAT